MKKRLFIFLLFFYSTISNQIFAQEDLTTSLSKNQWEPNYIGMFFGLFVVLGLVYLSAFIYQKLLKVKISKNINSNISAEIISTTPLGQNKNLHIIKVQDEYILIGATSNNISYIKNIEYYE